MSRPLARRLLAQPFATCPLPAVASRLPPAPARCFSQSTPRPSTSIADRSQATSSRPDDSLSSIASLLNDIRQDRTSFYANSGNISSDGRATLSTPAVEYKEPHHFHVYATKHNTHITVTGPDRNPLISVSTGNIGFRKGARKNYDSAFQLASHVMALIQDKGLTAEIQQLEVVLRGFGAGREAVTKALLGTEGRLLRNKVSKVTDATRLKFGGTRSKKPRRLG